MQNVICLVRDCVMNIDNRCTKQQLRLNENGHCILNEKTIKSLKEKKEE